MIELTIVDRDNQELFKDKGSCIDCVYNREYHEGDKIIVHKKDTEFLLVPLDETITESIIFIPTSTLEFEIPFGDLRRGYDEKAFSGSNHRIKVSEPEDAAYELRNIALNSHDKRGQRAGG